MVDRIEISDYSQSIIGLIPLAFSVNGKALREMSAGNIERMLELGIKYKEIKGPMSLSEFKGLIKYYDELPLALIIEIIFALEADIYPSEIAKRDAEFLKNILEGL